MDSRIPFLVAGTYQVLGVDPAGRRLLVRKVGKPHRPREGEHHVRRIDRPTDARRGVVKPRTRVDLEGVVLRGSRGVVEPDQVVPAELRRALRRARDTCRDLGDVAGGGRTVLGPVVRYEGFVDVRDRLITNSIVTNARVGFGWTATGGFPNLKSARMRALRSVARRPSTVAELPFNESPPKDEALAGWDAAPPATSPTARDPRHSNAAIPTLSPAARTRCRRGEESAYNGIAFWCWTECDTYNKAGVRERARGAGTRSSSDSGEVDGQPLLVRWPPLLGRWPSVQLFFRVRGPATESEPSPGRASGTRPPR